MPPVFAADRFSREVRGPRRPWLRARLLDIVILLASALPSALVVLYWILHLSRQLHVSTTTIGFPTQNDWNSARYFTAYRLVVVAFPLLTLVGFLVLTSLARWVGLYGVPSAGGPAAAGGSEPDARLEQSRWRADVDHVARSTLVGGVLGAEAAVARNLMGSAFWWQLALGAILLAAAAGVALAIGRLRAGLADRLAASLTALAAIATVPGLAWVAASTTLTVRAGGVVHSYNWFPGDLALPATLAAAVVVLASLWRSRTEPPAWRRVATRSVVYIPVPVIIFLSYAFIPGASHSFNYFEDGQLLSTVTFLAHGYLPFRDFYSLHGVVYDGLQPLAGTSLLSHSYWGMLAGIDLIVVPVGLVVLYIFAAAMYERGWPLALLVIVVPGFLARPGAMYGELMQPYARFILWPVALILLKVAVSRRSVAWSIALGVTVIVAAVLTPEAAYFVPAIGLAVVGRDVYHREQGWRVASFRRTLGLIVGGALAAVPFAVFLVSSGSVGSLVAFYRFATADHGLQAAGPIQVNLHDPAIFFAAAAPVAATLLTMLWIGIHLRWRIPLIDLDWVLVAAAALTAVYYEKWLAVPDLHVLESYEVALPLFFAWGARILLILDTATVSVMTSRIRTRSRSPGRVGNVWSHSPVSTALFAALLIAMNAAVLTWAPLTAQQYRASAPINPQNAKLGYMTPGSVDYGQIEDLQTFLAAYLRPGDRIFDFSDTPGLYYYLLPYKPATLSYEMTGISNQFGQENLIARLKQTRPTFVVWASLENGLPVLGGVWNMTRLYFVSQYILSNYRPFADVRNEVFFARKSVALAPPSSVALSQSPSTEGLDFAVPCDWGYSLNFLSARPAVQSAGVQTLPAAPAGQSTTLQVPGGLAWSHFDWVQVRFNHPPPRESLAISDGPGTNHTITFRTTGRGPSALWIPIGACAQWHGYGSRPLTITQSNPQPLTIKLVP